MYVSRETPEQTEERLLHIIAKAECRFYEGAYAFEEFTSAEFHARLRVDALVLVRDDQGWSQLVPCTDTSTERFGIFRFHFPPGLDNSGFVGWLATRLKNKFGTGVFVVCGPNSQRGGIFDYNGCPIELKEEVFSEIRALLAGSSKADRDT
jgi:hypothetical protein